jgi:hypothetical protein
MWFVRMVAKLVASLMNSNFPIANPKQGIVVINMGLYGPLYTWAQYTPTPPRSLNYRRSGVQDWATRKLTPPAAVFKTGQEESTNRVQRANTPPPQPQLATGYVEAGSKLQEGQGGQPLGEDVSKLGGSRDMEDPNIANCDSVAHEV